MRNQARETASGWAGKQGKEGTHCSRDPGDRSPAGAFAVRPSADAACGLLCLSLLLLCVSASCCQLEFNFHVWITHLTVGHLFYYKLTQFLFCFTLTWGLGKSYSCTSIIHFKVSFCNYLKLLWNATVHLYHSVYKRIKYFNLKNKKEITEVLLFCRFSAFIHLYGGTIIAFFILLHSLWLF